MKLRLIMGISKSIRGSACFDRLFVLSSICSLCILLRGIFTYFSRWEIKIEDLKKLNVTWMFKERLAYGKQRHNLKLLSVFSLCVIFLKLLVCRFLKATCLAEMLAAESCMNFSFLSKTGWIVKKTEMEFFLEILDQSSVQAGFTPFHVYFPWMFE